MLSRTLHRGCMEVKRLTNSLSSREVAASVTSEQIAEAHTIRDVFRKWVAKNILTCDAQGHRETIIMLPLQDAKPDYRDDPRA